MMRAGRDGAVAFPVLIANSGHRIALDYTVSIFFYTPRAAAGPRLVDVVTESLEFNLYVADPRTLRRVELRERVSAAEIRRDYDSYMPGAGRFGDGIYLSGSIVEAGSYELVHVELRAATELKEFFVVFTVSCPDAWMRDATYVQRCLLDEIADSPRGELAAHADRGYYAAERSGERPLGPGSAGGPGKSRRKPARHGPM
jgi:hypothetical protein